MYEGKTQSWDTDKKCPKLRQLPICRRRWSRHSNIRQRWRYIPCNNVLYSYIILWKKNQQIVGGLLNCANRDMQRKKERKNLRSSETAAPHVGSIKKTSFAIKSETRLQSDFGILKFQFRVFSNFVESEFREFFAEFYGPSNEQVRRKKFHCLNFGHFLSVSQLWVLPSYTFYLTIHSLAKKCLDFGKRHFQCQEKVTNPVYV